MQTRNTDMIVLQYIEINNTILKQKSDEGYRVVSIFTNEIGKNSLSVAGVGVNSTVDQTVVIFERPRNNS